MPATRAIVNKPVLVHSYPAIGSRHKILMAVLAKPFFKAGRKPDFVLHCNPSCHLDIVVRECAVFPEHFFGLLEQELNSLFCYFLLLKRLFVILLRHLLIFIF